MNMDYVKIENLLTPTKINFLWMMLANGIYALCQWGMLIVLAKLGSPEIVGQFALGIAITAPVIMIANMQLRGVQATDARKEYFLADYMAVRIASTAVALLVILLILYLGHFSREVFFVTVILTLAKAVESLSDVFYGFFQQHEKMGFLAVSMIIKGISSVGVLAFIFYISSSLRWALTGLFCVWLAVLVCYDVSRVRPLVKMTEGATHGDLLRSIVTAFSNRRKFLARMILMAFPLGIVMGIISLNSNIPRYAIEKFLGARDLGIFAALVYTTVAVNMFILALGQAVAPKMSRCFATRDIPGFKSILNKMIVINLVIGLAGVLVISAGGKWILSLLYTAEYADYSNLFILLMVCATVMGIASAYGFAMTAARQFKLQVPLFLVVLFSTALISYIFIPQFKLNGAALALLVSAGIQIGGSALIVQREINRAVREGMSL
ncbi:MAG: oligosaccharide flippase family protein [Candidatus Omnitrophota bacterium]